MQRRNKAIDLAAAVKRWPIPRAGKVARLGEASAGAAQTIDRPAGIERAARPPQRTAHAIGWTLQHFLEPGAERARIDAVRLRLSQHREHRIDARLDRPLAQQLGAKPVDGVDVRFLEFLERQFQPHTHDVVRGLGSVGAVLLEFFAQPQLQLASRLLRERDGDDLAHGRATGREHTQDAVHQLRRLAGPGGRLDDQRIVEIVRDRAPRLRVLHHALHHRPEPPCPRFPPW